MPDATPIDWIEDDIDPQPSASEGGVEADRESESASVSTSGDLIERESTT